MKRNASGVRSDARAKRLLVLILSAIVAIALGVTCAFCVDTGRRASVSSVENALPAESVTTYTNSTKTTFQNAVKNNTIRSGDYIDFAYTGGMQSVTLYKGVYWLEVYGAVGGNDNVAAGSASAGYSYGGNGGYSFAQFTVTSTSGIEVYIAVGGAGATAASGRGGGYNGGGNAGSTGGSGAGGGATHMAAGVNAVLTSLTSAQRTSNLLLVAGGGGGGGYSCYRGGVGGGGNKNGTNGAGANGGTAGYGGTQTAAGSGGNAGSGSQGGHRSGDGAGGGGGWYGGGAPTGDGGAGGGSGHIGSPSSSYGTIAYGGGVSGANSGAGKARITYLNSNTTTTASALNSGTATANSYINFGYTGNVQSISLPIGTYRFEVFGGAGGNDSGSAYGGYGGYTYGIHNVTAAKTLYVVCGGKGANNAAGSGGGYNGGGNPGTVGSSGAGGGATHISTVNGVLSASNKNSALIIAGGAGGGGYNSYVGGDGGGGNNAGGNGSGSSGGTFGYGGTASGVGSGGNAGNGTVGGSRASGTDGGAGGGGWFGGGAPTGDGAGGGGSGRIVSGVSDAGGVNGANSGSGFARITIINVSPVAKTSGGTVVNSSSPVARGGSITVSASTFAKDPEGGNVYFSNGDSNRETCTNVRLYINAACTTEATKYVQWTANTSGNGGASINITKVLICPTSGVDGQTSNDTLTLYAKIRDTYGATTTHGLAVVPFKVKIGNNKMVVRTTSNMNSGGRSTNGYVEYTKTNADGTYVYRLGNSNKTGSDIGIDYTNNAGIFNPSGNSRKTVFVTAPLTQWRTNGFTIYADDLYADADSAYDIVGFSAYGTSSYTDYYTVSTTASSYNSNVKTAITVKPTNRRPTSSVAVAITLTGCECDKNSKNIINTTNSSDGNVVELVFKISNTRPYFASAVDNVNKTAEPHLQIQAGGDATLSISQFLYDADGTTPTFVTGTGNLKLPSKEYVCVTAENKLVALTAVSGVPSNYANYNNDSNICKTAGQLSSSTGEGTVNVWNTEEFTPDVLARVILPATDPNASKAWVTYSYDNNTTIRFHANFSSQYMYAADGRRGDFYVLVRVSDPGEPTDDGIWFPIMITAISAAPREPNEVATFTLSYTDGSAGTSAVDAAPGVTEPLYLTPLSYMVDDTLYGIGAISANTVGESRARPFVYDRDGFRYPTDDPQILDIARRLNDVVMLKSTVDGDNVTTVLEDVVTANNTNQFFRIELVPLYAYRSVFLGMSEHQLKLLNIRNYSANPGVADAIVTFYGLKVTALCSTNEQYLQFDVNVTDSHMTLAEANPDGNRSIRVFIRVSNRDVAIRRDPSSSTDFPINANASYATYRPYDSSYGTDYVNYTIEKDQTIYVTPYDFAYDFDTTYDYNTTLNSPDNFNYINAGGTFNSNPNDPGFAGTGGFAERVLAWYSVKSTSVPLRYTQAAGDSTLSRGQLSFVESSRFSDYSDYVNAEIVSGWSDGVHNYAIPCIRITAVSRTSANVPILRFYITDGYSQVEFAITVTVANSAPELYVRDYNGRPNPNYRDCYEITTDPIKNNSYPGAYEFSAPALAIDRDGDTPQLISGTVRIVAYDKDQTVDGAHYFEYIKLKSGSTSSYEGCASNVAGAIKLSDYVAAYVTQGTGAYIGLDVLRFEAVSSTQLFDLPIYIEFQVTDGFRAQPRSSKLYIGVEVMNAECEFVSDSLDTAQIAAAPNQDSKVWYISYESLGQKAITRYIVNDAELYNSPAIQASDANKKLLFSDPDKTQTVLLSSATGNVTDAVGAVETSADVTASHLGNAAILYNKTYNQDSLINSQVEPYYNHNYLSVKLIIYNKNPETNTFERITGELPTKLDDCKYWAIEITDLSGTANDYSSVPTRFLISVKDDHHKNIVFDGTDGVDDDGNPVRKQANDTSDDIPNNERNLGHSSTYADFYYIYQKPGIKAMQEYYRTEGNVESQVSVDGTAENYVVDYDCLYPYQFKKDALPTYTAPQTKQSILASADFNDDFKYQYFVNVYSNTTTDEENHTETTVSDVVSNRYADSSGTAFYYKPITITSSASMSVDIPMSYIAMPQIYNVKTGNLEDGVPHVVFANLETIGSSSMYTYGDYNGTYKFLNWIATDTDHSYEDLVFENLTLYDGKTTWRGTDIRNNPYININFNADRNIFGDHSTQAGGLNTINFWRGELEYNSQATDPKQIYQIKTGSNFGVDSTVSNCYEDKYGFTVSRKSGATRLNGTLRLTVAVKKYSVSRQTGAGGVEVVTEDAGIIEYAPLDIIITNSEPYDFKIDGTTFGDTHVTQNVILTAGDNVGSLSGAFVEYKNNSQASALPAGTVAANINYTSIQYSDADATDIMKFVIPSSSNHPLSTVFTTTELARISEDYAVKGGTSYKAYITDISGNVYDGKTIVDTDHGGDGQVHQLGDLIPNPGYEKFFTISPEIGTNQLLRIKPKAKTAINIPASADRAAYLLANNLKEDDSGNIYYPFKILAYDDCAGSGFVNGYWVLNEIRVYINNDGIKSNDVPAKLSLTKGVNYAFDVSTILSDSDIPLVGQSMSTSMDDWGDDLPHPTTETMTVSDNATLIKDLLVMPVREESGTTVVDFTAKRTYKKVTTDISDLTTLPITITASGSQLVFTANSAFQDTIYVTMTFRDNAIPTSSSVDITFTVEYTNEAPTKNPVTFADGSNVIDIVMKTNDSFTLFAVDTTTIEADENGRYASPGIFYETDTNGKRVLSDGKPQYKLSNYPNGISASALYDDFLKFTTSDYDESKFVNTDPAATATDAEKKFIGQHANGNLGSLIIATDDAPSTVKFAAGSSEFADTNIRGMFEIEEGESINSGETYGPVSLKVTALGVTNNAIFNVVVKDSEKRTTLTMRITVLPTAPVVNSDADLARLGLTKLTGSDIPENTYRLNLNYGDSRTFNVKQIMHDVDEGDDADIKVTTDSGNEFTIINPSGLLAVGATSGRNNAGATFTLNATDFIPIEPGEGKTAYTDVQFSVSDIHGAKSETINIRVYIAPRNAVTAAEDPNNIEETPARLNIKDYATYYSDSTPQTFDIVSDSASASIIRDLDVSAPSARYAVTVYALVDKTNTSIDIEYETFKEMSDTDREALIIVKLDENGTIITTGSGAVSDYVNRFFTISLAMTDGSTPTGKTMTITPKSAVISANGMLDEIHLCIRVEKVYEKADDSKTMAPVDSVAYVKVADSAPIAVRNNSQNNGYPHVGTGTDEKPRNEDFLSFTGHVGDSVTWNVVSKTNNRNLGLFYDYDMINNAGGNEQLTIAQHRVGTLTNINERENLIDGGKVKPNEPVLAITPSRTGDSITITINRKVKDMYRKVDTNGRFLPMVIPVEVFCADRVAAKAGNASFYVKTTITVTIENDPVSFREITTADGLGYTVQGDDEVGYDMYLSVAYGDSSTIRVQDFVRDGDLAFDQFSIMTTDSPCLNNANPDNPATIVKSGETLFTYYTVSNANDYGYQSLKSITFTGASTKRGTEIVYYLKISDSESQSGRLSIHLTVGNTAPTPAPIEKRTIHVMGADPSGNGTEIAFSDNIINYVEDINTIYDKNGNAIGGDCIDVATNYDPSGTRKSNTYVWIDSHILYTEDTAPTPDDRPIIYGPTYENQDTSDPDAELIKSVCDLTMIETDVNQVFGIEITPGVYGTQKIIVKVCDSGYNDGNAADPRVTDGLYRDIELIVTVACPIIQEDIAPFAIADQVTRKVTPELLLNTEDEPYRANGYTISDITVTGNIERYKPTSALASAYSATESAATENDWRIKAVGRGEGTMTVTFNVGNERVTHTFPVRVTENHAPVVRLTDSKAIYSKNDPKMREGNIIKISPEEWFSDPDIDDVLRFVPTVKVKVSSFATATLNAFDNTIDIKFKAKGETPITICVSDASNETYPYVITVGCMDMEELGWWGSFVASIESNPLMFWLILAAVLIFIIALIIILVVVHKRRKMRREIEALLNSEAELNEEMMRLSSGQSTMYQSYGYLPPTTQTMNNPGLMLGSSSSPNINNLQLGSGTGQTSGIVTDVTAYPKTNPKNDPVPPTNSIPGVYSVPTSATDDGFDPDSF